MGLRHAAGPRYQIRFSPEIAKASKDSGIDGVPRTSDGNPNLLGASRNYDYYRLNAYYDRPDNRWNRDNGFAFAVSQFSSFLSLCRRVFF